MQISQVQNPTMNHLNPNFNGLSIKLIETRLNKSFDRCGENATVGQIKKDLSDNAAKHCKKFLKWTLTAIILFGINKLIPEDDNLKHNILNVFNKIIVGGGFLMSALHLGTTIFDLLTKIKFAEEAEKMGMSDEECIEDIPEDDNSITDNNTENDKDKTPNKSKSNMM